MNLAITLVIQGVVFFLVAWAVMKFFWPAIMKGWRRRTCPKDWRAIRREFEWLGAKRGRQLDEVTGIRQTGVGEGYALLCKEGRERIKHHRKSVSAYAAEKLGVLQPIQIP